MRVQDDIKNKPRSYLLQLKNRLLDIQCRFITLKTKEDMWWHEYNWRERLSYQSQAISQTAYQRICGVMRVIADRTAKHGKAAATQAKIVALYAEKAMAVGNTAAEGENQANATESFIREAFLVVETMFSVPGVEAAIQHLDTCLGHTNPLDSVHKLGYIRRHAKTPAMIKWVTLGLVDNILAGVETVQSISVNDMKAGKGKCLVSAFVLKKQVLDYVLTRAGGMWPFNIVAKMREVFASHENFRKLYRTFEGTAANDLSYMADWPNSARFFTDFVANALFSHQHPYAGSFHTIAKTGQPMNALFKHTAFMEMWDRIEATNAKEKKAMTVQDHRMLA